MDLEICVNEARFFNDMGPKNNKHVAYLITTRILGHDPIEVWRRFSEFRKCHGKWLEILGSQKNRLPPLPKKSLFRKFDRATIERRRKSYDSLLKRAIGIPQLVNDERFLDFIGVTPSELSRRKISEESPGGEDKGPTRDELVIQNEELKKKLSSVEIENKKRIAEFESLTDKLYKEVDFLKKDILTHERDHELSERKKSEVLKEFERLQIDKRTLEKKQVSLILQIQDLEEWKKRTQEQMKKEEEEIEFLFPRGDIEEMRKTVQRQVDKETEILRKGLFSEVQIERENLKKELANCKELEKKLKESVENEAELMKSKLMIEISEQKEQLQKEREVLDGMKKSLFDSVESETELMKKLLLKEINGDRESIEKLRKEFHEEKKKFYEMSKSEEVSVVESKNIDEREGEEKISSDQVNIQEKSDEPTTTVPSRPLPTPMKKIEEEVVENGSLPLPTPKKKLEEEVVENGNRPLPTPKKKLEKEVVENGSRPLQTPKKKLEEEVVENEQNESESQPEKMKEEIEKNDSNENEEKESTKEVVLIPDVPLTPENPEILPTREADSPLTPFKMEEVDNIEVRNENIEEERNEDQNVEIEKKDNGNEVKEEENKVSVKVEPFVEKNGNFDESSLGKTDLIEKGTVMVEENASKEKIENDSNESDEKNEKVEMEVKVETKTQEQEENEIVSKESPSVLLEPKKNLNKFEESLREGTEKLKKKMLQKIEEQNEKIEKKEVNFNELEKTLQKSADEQAEIIKKKLSEEMNKDQIIVSDFKEIVPNKIEKILPEVEVSVIGKGNEKKEPLNEVSSAIKEVEIVDSEIIKKDVEIPKTKEMPKSESIPSSSIPIPVGPVVPKEDEYMLVKAVPTRIKSKRRRKKKKKVKKRQARILFSI